MNSMQALVREFHKKIGAPAPTYVLYPHADRLKLRLNLIREEVDELFQEATTYRPSFDQMVAESVDVLVVTIGFLVELGVDIDPVFAEIMAANMRKVGGPMRDDGKILKPEGWVPADVSAVLDAQLDRYHNACQALLAKATMDPVVTTTEDVVSMSQTQVRDAARRSLDLLAEDTEARVPSHVLAVLVAAAMLVEEDK